MGVCIPYDKEIFGLIGKEKQRQSNGLELIPSENYVSPYVRQAVSSVLTNKYSEGYPGHRYYGGQEYTDQIEIIAIERAKRLFNADHANVQPHSGAQANNAVYNAWLDPGDTVLGMDLSFGGHLTHGSPVTQSAKFYNFIGYHCDIQTGELNYAEIEHLASEYHPKILLVGYSAYPRIPDFARLAEIGKRNNCLLMADMSHVAGLIAAGVHPNPLDYGFHIMTTTTHKTLRGPRGGLILTKGKVSRPDRRVDRVVDNIPTLVDRSVFPGTQGGPLMHVIAAKAVAFYEASQESFTDYAIQVLDNADQLAKSLIERGAQLVYGGTDNHLMMVNTVSTWGIDGAQVEAVLDKIGLTLNKNLIPNDTNPPSRPSGIRLGTPAVTTRGLGMSDMAEIASWIDEALCNYDSPKELAKLHRQVTAMAQAHPCPR